MTSESRAEPMMSSRISGPAELLQAVPYLLGFHPADSLVLVGLHGGRLVVTARMDLVDAHVPEIAAQTLDYRKTHLLAAEEIVVATTNVGHLSLRSRGAMDGHSSVKVGGGQSREVQVEARRGRIRTRSGTWSPLFTRTDVPTTSD